MRTKFSIEFTARQKRALAKLAVDLETNEAGVLKQAFSLLTIAVREIKKGHQIVVSRDGRVVRTITGITVRP